MRGVHFLALHQLVAIVKFGFFGFENKAVFFSKKNTQYYSSASITPWIAGIYRRVELL